MKALQHCLFCCNGGVSTDEKTILLEEFVKDGCHQKLFHINQFSQKQEIFEFIAKTTSSQQQSSPAQQ